MDTLKIIRTNLKLSYMVSHFITEKIFNFSPLSVGSRVWAVTQY